MSRLDFIAVAYELPPWPVAGAVAVSKMLGELRKLGWTFEVVTATPGASLGSVPVHVVPDRRPPLWASWLDKAKLSKLRELLQWSDQASNWHIDAFQVCQKIIRQRRPKLILNFMMPYSAGLVGAHLKQDSGLPLVYWLGDSPSCTDMHPCYPSYFHYRHALKIEDYYVKMSDAMIYVSKINADSVRARQPAIHHRKFHVVRRGADDSEFAPAPGIGPDLDQPVCITYIGSMGGWHEWYKRSPGLSWLKSSMDDIGRYHRVRLIPRTYTPIFLGRAVQQVLITRPEWSGKIFIDLIGERIASEAHIARVLEATRLTDVIRVHGALPREEFVHRARTADLLFQCLPDRADGSPGGRISLKTYEYLMTDRPILAALPRGENWNYCSDKPGVWLVAPDDTAGMARAITAICEAKFDRRKPLCFDRSAFRYELSYANRAQEFTAILQTLRCQSLEPT